MGITETVIGWIKPILDSVGVPVHNLGTSVVDVIVVVAFLKRRLDKWLNMEGWMVVGLGLVVSMVSALQFFALGAAAIVVGGLGTFLLSVGQLATSGRLGHVTPKNPFGANPSKNPG